MVWEQLKPVVGQFRETFKEPNMLKHLEETAKRFEEWSDQRSPGHIAAMREYMQQERAKAKGAAGS